MPETDRLIIREIDQADAQQFLATTSDGEEMTSYTIVAQRYHGKNKIHQNTT